MSIAYIAKRYRLSALFVLSSSTSSRARILLSVFPSKSKKQYFINTEVINYKTQSSWEKDKQAQYMITIRHETEKMQCTKRKQ